MKLEITLKNGKYVTIDNVESYREENPKYGLAQTSTMVNITFKHGGTTSYEVAQKPTEGKLFKVAPLQIDRKKFEEPRSNQKQEWCRKDILGALAMVDWYPEKYASEFYTYIPVNVFGHKKMEDFEKIVYVWGGLNFDCLVADLTEQKLEWAQRICNGEAWEDVCNNADTAKWYRVVRGRDGYGLVVGGSSSSGNALPASNVPSISHGPDYIYKDCVPLVVYRKK